MCIRDRCYIILYPFFIKIINAFKTYSDFIDPTVRFLPKNFTLDNIKHVINEMNYWTTLRNTVVICLILSPLQTLVCAVTAVSYTHLDVYKRQRRGYREHDKVKG